TSALWLVEGKSKGGDDVGKGIVRSGGVPDDDVLDDSGWEVDGVSALSQIIAALYPNGKVGLASGDNHGESGDGGGDGMARSLSISASDQTGVGGCSLIDILAVIRYTSGGRIESAGTG
nr:hypothetical protein [Tanacetum cinerariifolium]